MKADNNSKHNGKDKLGRFLPGNPGKPKGSSKNKLRDKIRLFINDNWDEMPQWFSELKPREKFEVLIAFMPYSVSRLQSIAVTDSDGNDIQQKTVIDYTKLKPETIREILKHTKTIEDEITKNIHS